MPYYEVDNPEKLNVNKYNTIKNALTSYPITNSNTFQVKMILTLKIFYKLQKAIVKF